MEQDIFDRDKNGEIISIDDPEFPKIGQAIERAQKIISRLNNSYHDAAAVRSIFSELTSSIVHDSFELLPPFYTDFGQNIRVGKDVFINQGCTFMDRGGITIEDKVLFGPKVNLVTINHPVAPNERRSTYNKPIHIKKGAWIGINATIMPGVTIGINSIVSAGSVVTKDVDDNVIVAGVPAKVIKQINPDE
ncbi:sugar O-acetyltransferase [Shouchella hunanensis]|uniref:Sugar O-acetyltransferase n=1 Tax=Shouchella hunanensis TaxID=766894 RepID=A0ABY7W9E8_9BACI|nr:sugar O-acetyltransferase [Shouchella hunanensis]WDF05540.1 sugar O-acetyltransferase [Shouchella hunanensis]